MSELTHFVWRPSAGLHQHTVCLNVCYFVAHKVKIYILFCVWHAEVSWLKLNDHSSCERQIKKYSMRWTCTFINCQHQIAESHALPVILVARRIYFIALLHSCPGYHTNKISLSSALCPFRACCGSTISMKIVAEKFCCLWICIFGCIFEHIQAGICCCYLIYFNIRTKNINNRNFIRCFAWCECTNRKTIK